MKLFIFVVLATSLVLAKPSHKRLDQAPNQLNIDAEGYLDAVFSSLPLTQDKPFDFPFALFNYTNVNDDKVDSLSLNGNNVSISALVTGTNITVTHENGTTILSSIIILNNIVLTFNYKASLNNGDVIQRGELAVQVDDFIMSFQVFISDEGQGQEASPGFPLTVDSGNIVGGHVTPEDVDQTVTNMVTHILTDGFDVLYFELAVSGGLRAALSASFNSTNVNSYITQ
ncbi:unnamed protein product [Timema podura]|uniref:Uncharacterized protein n=1 Tax=Timema podura TaxID=61482 RepID=A0ABN7PC80_TIMPD|nr:unnamed protein product [Timema podura]